MISLVAETLIKTIRDTMNFRCPQCGEGGIYSEGSQFVKTCENCELPIQRREGDCWFAVYFTTGVLTGVFFILVGLIFFILKLAAYNNLYVWGVLIVLQTVLMIKTMRKRKAFALALDYWVDTKPINFN